jgi:hypothetical protein
MQDATAELVHQLQGMEQAMATGQWNATPFSLTGSDTPRAGWEHVFELALDFRLALWSVLRPGPPFESHINLAFCPYACVWNHYFVCEACLKARAKARALPRHVLHLPERLKRLSIVVQKARAFRSQALAMQKTLPALFQWKGLVDRIPSTVDKKDIVMAWWQVVTAPEQKDRSMDFRDLRKHVAPMLKPVHACFPVLPAEFKASKETLTQVAQGFGQWRADVVWPRDDWRHYADTQRASGSRPIPWDWMVVLQRQLYMSQWAEATFYAEWCEASPFADPKDRLTGGERAVAYERAAQALAEMVVTETEQQEMHEKDPTADTYMCNSMCILHSNKEVNTWQPWGNHLPALQWVLRQCTRLWKRNEADKIPNKMDDAFWMARLKLDALAKPRAT